MHSPPSLGIGASGVVLLLALAGCTTTSAAEAENGLIQVVASTDVYGDIVAQIGGDSVEITSIISGAAQDPHSYEATARDQLALSTADLVIENGGGYDPFIDTMLEASGGADVVVVNAAEASGLLDDDNHDDGNHDDDSAEHAQDDAHNHIEGFNEHVWYSFSAVKNIVAEIAHELATIDHANAAAYETNREAFVAELESLEELAHGLRDRAEGDGVAITEPVPTYLLEEIGLENKTPDAFSEAIEEGTDVAPAVLRMTLDLVSNGSVVLLAYNEQTAGRETEQLRAAAESAGIAVLPLAETLPDGKSYLTWMRANLDALDTVLE